MAIYREKDFGSTLCHFNQNHDPETGKFTDDNGRFISDRTKARIKNVAKSVGRYALRGAVIAASVASGKLVANALSGAATAFGAQMVGNILASGVGQIGMSTINSALGADGSNGLSRLFNNPQIQAAMSTMQQQTNDPATAAALQDTISQVLVDYGS